MRRNKCYKKFGIAAIGLGVLIILAMVMPVGFWVIMLGAFFVIIGILICRK